MLDTIRLKSDYLTEEQAAKIEKSLKRRMCLDMQTGVLEYDIISGSLEGSYDNRVSVKVCREEYKAGAKIEVMPYVIIEGSVHKAMMGHNVYGGTSEILPACRWFIYEIEKRLDCFIGNDDTMKIQRIDLAECYDFGTFENCAGYIAGLNLEVFPRRGAPTRYGNECLYSSGVVTVKIYHKGPEFAKHDRRRLRGVFDDDKIDHIQSIADKIIRTETSISAKWLKYHYGKIPTLSEINTEHLENEHYKQVGKLISEAKSKMDIVRTTELVRDRIYNNCTTRQANKLFGLWLQLAALGEEKVKRTMHRSTMYRGKKQLLDLGCSWTGSDVMIDKSKVVHLTIGKSSPQRLIDVDDHVEELISQWRRAA